MHDEMRFRTVPLLMAALILAGCSVDNSGMWPPEAWPVELRGEKHQAEAARAQQQAQPAQQVRQVPRARRSIRERMRELKVLYLEQLITPAEYEAKKAAVLDEL